MYIPRRGLSKADRQVLRNAERFTSNRADFHQYVRRAEAPWTDCLCDLCGTKDRTYPTQRIMCRHCIQRASNRSGKPYKAFMGPRMTLVYDHCPTCNSKEGRLFQCRVEVCMRCAKHTLSEMKEHGGVLGQPTDKFFRKHMPFFAAKHNILGMPTPARRI